MDLHPQKMHRITDPILTALPLSALPSSPKQHINYGSDYKMECEGFSLFH